MTTLADKAILLGADNRPPMLEKDMYDSWKSRMELYMTNREHGRMILESVENGPLIWPSIEENGVTRPKKYSELSATKAIQANCDIKATKISFSKDYHQKSTHWKESEQFQVNTKFLNTLLLEWSKFVTDVKLVQDLHTNNIDQLHAYLGQHEFHTNERGNDPIDAINHVMSFLSAVITSSYPTTNNQLRNSSNPRQQPPLMMAELLYNQFRGDKFLLYQVQVEPTLQEQVESILGNKGRLFVTTAKGKAICPNSALNPRGNGMISDPDIPEGQATQTVITHNATYQADDLDAYDFDCDELNTAKVALMANLSHYGSDALAEIHNHDKVNNNMLNQVVQAMPSSEQSNVEAVQNSNSFAQQDALILSVIEQLKTQVVNCTKINLDNQKYLRAQSVEIDRLKQTLFEHLKEKESLMKTVTLLKNDFKKEESRNIDREIALEKKIKQLDNIVFKRDQSAQTVHMLTKPQFFYDHITKQALAHSAYIKHTQEEAAILRDLVEHVKSNYPLHHSLESACWYTKRIQELLTNISKTCLSINNSGEKLVAVTPKNKDKRCNGCMLSDNHDLCVLDFINNVNARVKSKSVKKSLKRKVWKPTGKVFTNIGYIWRPTIVGNTYPLTRITTTTEVPLRKPTALKNETPKPVVTLVYSRKPRKSKTNVPVSKSKVVQIVLWYLDSGCSKHMTGDRSQLTNFLNKFLGTVKFENDHVAKILGYDDYPIRNVTISRVYYIEGLGHNLFFVGQFCDSNLEVAFRQHTCFIHNLEGLPKLKFEKDHLCSACAMGKSKKKPHKPKSEDTNQEKLYLLHMDLCGPMRVASVNGKKYILIIVDDYSRFTWVKCLRSKDEAPDFIIKFLKMIQVRLKVHVRRIRTDNGTEFVNQTLREYYEKVGISHETSVARSPQQNGAEAVATACYTQNRSIVRLRHGKTPYELLHDKPPDLSFFHVFGALCYPTNDSENLGKLQPKADIGIFIGYAPTKKAFRIYNRRTRRIIETIHVDFDELTAMASEHSSSGPALHEMTPATISSGLVPNPPPSTPVDYPDTEVIAPIPEVIAPIPAVSTNSPSSTNVDQDAPSPSHSQTTPKTQPPVIPNDVKEDNHDIEIAHMGNDPYFGIPIPEIPSDQSSSSDSIQTIVHPDHQISEHNSK
ncbi:retrovirus-related pol polyprotein from transposon TNT 1-94 [Tanacetum coccineum]